MSDNTGRDVDFAAQSSEHSLADSSAHSLARVVLGSLLDKYEASEAFRKGVPSSRRIQVRLTDALVPGYATGQLDPDVRHALHALLRQMADRGFIELRWVKFEEGNILYGAYLLWDALDNVYAYLGRTPRRDELTSITAEMERWVQELARDGKGGGEWKGRGSCDDRLSGTGLCSAGLPTDWKWLRTWVDEVVSSIELRGRIPANLLPDDAKTRQLLLRTLAGLVRKGDSTVPSRLFSKQVLGHSKTFELEVKSHLLRLIRRYWPVLHPHDVEAPDDDSALLREFGIEAGHDDIAFCGPIHLRYDDEATANGQAQHGASDEVRGEWKRDHHADAADIDASIFPYGLSVDASDVHRIHITQMAVSRILTIENKANYRVYVRSERPPDELVIYLGGFASPAQREFLRLLREFVDSAGIAAGARPAGVAESNGTASIAGVAASVGTSGSPRVPLQHWGDLDYGGILILQHLKNTCWPEATAWRMEPELLSTYGDYLEPIDDAYRAKLARLLESDGYAWAHSLVRRILGVGGILEQEALLV